MTKSKEKTRGNISVATEIERLQERRDRCEESLERAEFRRRKEQLSARKRQLLEDEISIIHDRLQNLDKELALLRGENRRNMLLSVALLAASALFYYAFFHSDEDH